MTILFSGNMATGATDNITLSGNTQSMEVLNLSHFDLQISSDTMGSWKLPARCTKTYKVSPSDYIQFTLADNPFQPTTLTGEYIQVTQSTEATETGITPLSMIPSFVDNVDVQGGNVSITAGTVDVGTMPAVQIAAGQGVNIENTPAVTVSAGTVDINTMPGVSITNNSLNVQNTPGGSLTVAGTVDIGNTASVNISNSPTVNIASNQSVNIGNTPNVNVSGGNVDINSGTVDATVQNAILSTNPMFKFASGSSAVSNLAANSQMQFYPSNYTDPIYVDTLVVELTGVNHDNYKMDCTGVWFNPNSGAQSAISPLAGYTYEVQQSSDNSTYLMYISLGEPTLVDEIGIGMTNNSGATIAADTLNWNVYGIRTSLGTSAIPVQSKVVYSEKNASLGNTYPGGTSIPAGGTTGNFYSTTVALPNAKRARLYIQVLSASGFNSTTGVGVMIDVVGGIASPLSDSNAYDILSQANSFKLFKNGLISLDSGDFPGLIAGYEYITIKAYIENSSSSAVTASCEIAASIYWDE